MNGCHKPYFQPAITCSKLRIETLEQRCEICSKLTIKPPKQRHWTNIYVGSCEDSGNFILHSMLYLNSYNHDRVNYIILLMMLSMAYDSLLHNLLISKLEAYGINKDAVCLMENYLKNQVQRINRFLVQLLV